MCLLEIVFNKVLNYYYDSENSPYGENFFIPIISIITICTDLKVMYNSFLKNSILSKSD